MSCYFKFKDCAGYPDCAHSEYETDGIDRDENLGYYNTP